MAGSFIVIEGIEGSGKSTLISRLANMFADAGRPVAQTREPGATAAGKRIRELVLAHSTQLCSESELLLFLADRAQHVREFILPTLADGKVVLCDRFFWSTLAYQGFGRGLDLAILKRLNNFATQNLVPDLTLVLDLPPEAGLQRARSRLAIEQSSNAADSSWTKFESETIEFHRRIREGFLTLAEESPNEAAIIDASTTPEDTFTQACAELTKRGWL